MSGPGLVALAGVSGAGKDSAARYLAERHGFRRVAIADPLKETMMALFALTREQLWGDARNLPDPRLGRAPRELYQQFGRACREIDPDVWIRGFRARAAELLGGGERVVCTDLRTLAELRMVRELGGSAWLLRRPSAGAPGALAFDATETELGAVEEGRFDSVIWNDGTPAMLHHRLDQAFRCAAGLPCPVALHPHQNAETMMP
jgi:hypothetical protein